MKAKYFYIITLLTMIVFQSCETTEKIDDFPLRPSKLVLNCYFTNDSAWEFQISKSLSVLDNADLKLLDNAELKLYKDSELIDTSSVPDSDLWYRMDSVLPEFGANYTIEVTVPKYGTISAESYMPRKVDVKSVNVQITDSTFWRDDYYYEYDKNYRVYGNVKGFMNVSFDDPPGVDNYYQISIFNYDTIYDYYDTIRQPIGLRKDYIYFTTQDALTDDNSSSILFLDDEVFDGQSYKLRVSFEDWNAFEGKVYNVELHSLTRAGYLYKKSIEEYQSASGDPFAEPVLIYNNIENGYGIFTGYITEEFAFDLF